MRKSPREEGLPYEENGFKGHHRMKVYESEKEMDEYADEMNEYDEH